MDPVHLHVVLTSQAATAPPGSGVLLSCLTDQQDSTFLFGDVDDALIIVKQAADVSDVIFVRSLMPNALLESLLFNVFQALFLVVCCQDTCSFLVLPGGRCLLMERCSLLQNDTLSDCVYS